MNAQTKHNVLIVDDMPVNIKILGETLRSDYEVSIATTGEKALEIAFSQNQPDLILLDIIMPGLDGYEVCRRIMADQRTRNIPIIFITAKGDVEDETKGFELGAVDYISKPFSLPIVKARVKTWIHFMDSRKELEKKNKTLNEFIGVVAHDLKNPLAGISGYATILNMLNEKLSHAEKIKIIEKINDICQAMSRTLSNLLDNSIIECGKLKLNMGKISLEELCRERIQLFAIQTKNKKITVHESLGETDRVPLDKIFISQVLDNLISNAVKYSPRGANVFVSTEKTERGIKVSVRDEGPGICEEEKPLLFYPFQTLSAKPTGGEKSTGLGLAIVKKIIEAHEGVLEVNSRLGSGSIFSFVLPLKDESESIYLEKVLT